MALRLVREEGGRNGAEDGEVSDFLLSIDVDAFVLWMTIVAGIWALGYIVADWGFRPILWWTGR